MKSLVSTVFPSAVGIALSLCPAQAADRPPNIVMIMADDLGWNHHSAGPMAMGTNREFYQTPNIAKLAAGGLSFTHAYVQPNCAPTRACMLSGQYPPRVNNEVYVVMNLNRFGGGGVSKNKAKFAGPEQSEDVAGPAVTVAEALRKNGYTTAHFGKYHVGGHALPDTSPEDQGFDINIGGGQAGHQKSCFATKTKDGWQFKGTGYGAIDRYGAPYDKAYLEKHNMPASLEGTPKHVTDALTDAVEESIGTLSRGGKPFYIQLHTWAVHGPVKARPDLRAAAAGRLEKAGERKKMADYLGFIAGFDQAVGRVMERLDDPNGDGDRSDSIVANTVVFVTSDNGGTHADNLPLRGFKGEFYEGGIRVPLVASWKGVIPPGTVTHRPIHAVDLYPTYLELAGASWKPAPEEHPLDGESFANVLRDPSRADPRGPIFYLFPGYLDSRATPLASVIDRVDDTLYKLIYQWETGRWELYDLDGDVGEKNNLAADKPEIVKTLAGRIRGWLGQDQPTWKPRFPIDRGTGEPAVFPQAP